ncbi:MAG: MlaE family lipid ABC transporter permease subunit [Deltaproteobacteria bacterium]|nr:MlaE family lipid ABC transporter permease subunit [Deltaproteobacteria bacterium]
MTKSKQLSSRFYEISEKEKGQILILLKGKIDIKNSAYLLKELTPAIKGNALSSLVIDLGKVDYLDDFGALVLLETKRLVAEQKGKFSIVNVKDNIKGILSLVNFESNEYFMPLKKYTRPNILVHLGESAIQNTDNIRFFISFLGSVILSFIHVCLHPKDLRIDDTITYMKKTGVDALPIVALISFLLGLVMAFTSSLQLQQFGANIYVASLVSIAMVSELGPIMTAIVVAGRSGSAFAAEIGTMKISEEIDALFTMGFNTTIFLGVPRIIACIIVVPILTLFSDLFAISGGLMVGVFMLDLSTTSYINQTMETLTLFEVMWGLGKSFVFAALIAWIGCLRGFQTRGGADSVGNAATSAVVSSIFLIILFDSIFAVLRSYW